MAFMAAKNVSKAVAMAVKPFEDIGNQVGSLAKKIPQYTPIPGLGMSAASMAKVPQGIEHAMVASDNKRFEKSGIGKLLSADKNMPADIEKGIVDTMKNGNRILNTIEKQALSRENAYLSSAPKEMMDVLKGISSESEKKVRLGKIGITDSKAQDDIIKYVRGKNGELHNDQDKKEFLSKINAGLGGGTGASGGTGSSSSIANRI